MAKYGLSDKKYDTESFYMDYLNMEVEMSGTSPTKTKSLLMKELSATESPSTGLLSKKTRRGVVGVSIAMFFLAFLGWYYVSHHGRMGTKQLGNVFFDPDTRELFVAKQGIVIYHSVIGKNLPSDAYPLNCDTPKLKESICIDWLQSSEDDTHLANMLISKVGQGSVSRIRVQWTSGSYSDALMDCILTDKHHWFGGGDVYDFKWPMESIQIPMQPFVTNNLFEEQSSFGSVIERYWLNSNGTAITVAEDVPLFFSSNENDSQKICLKAEYLDSPYQNKMHDFPQLNYTIYVGDNVTHVHFFVIDNFFERPTGLPMKRVYTEPTYYIRRICTNLTQQCINKISENFSSNNISSGNIITNTDLRFSFTLKQRGMPLNLTSLENLGEESHFWIISHIDPFVPFSSNVFPEFLRNGYLLTDPTGDVPSLTRWASEVGGIMDMTNTQTTRLFQQKVEKYKTTYNLHSLLSDGISSSTLPHHFTSEIPIKDPSLFCKFYNEAFQKIRNNFAVSCGYKAQRLNVFVKMFEKESHWQEKNGLRSVIPAVMLYGLLGYPFILPAPIGGAMDLFEENPPLPDKELYMRWLGLSTYLPAMTFSVMPWEYQDDGLMEFAREMIGVHRKQVAPLIDKYAQEAVSKGYPIIRPLWWIAPTDVITHVINDEFLIGDVLLVAPVLDKGAKSRNIYLPEGLWNDTLRHQTIKGGMWLFGYSAKKKKVPTATLR